MAKSFTVRIMRHGKPHTVGQLYVPLPDGLGVGEGDVVRGVVVNRVVVLVVGGEPKRKRRRS